VPSRRGTGADGRASATCRAAGCAAPAFKPSASESKESLESQLGSKVLSKVAILLLLVAAALVP
jgi:hypothetical protein